MYKSKRLDYPFTRPLKMTKKTALKTKKNI